MSGITELSVLDFEYAKRMGATIKLVGVAKLSTDASKVAAFVSPCYVPRLWTKAMPRSLPKLCSWR